jgi:hypothetical protein
MLMSAGPSKELNVVKEAGCFQPGGVSDPDSHPQPSERLCSGVVIPVSTVLMYGTSARAGLADRKLQCDLRLAQ